MKKNWKITIGAMALTVCINTTSIAASHTVKKGESFWKISQKYGISLIDILKANNANEKTIIYPGQVVNVPDGKTTNTVSRGNIDRDSEDSHTKAENIIHIIEKGDTLWLLSEKYLVSMEDIISANLGLSKSSILNIGQALNIPNSGIDESKPVENDSKYGEYISWFGGADKLIPRGAQFKVIDFYTGKSFMVKRTVGTNHADCETLTKEDTNIMKSIWGGFSWERRPAIVEYNGRRIAASVSFMPHAGLDSVPGGVTANNRSGGYGRGVNLDYVKGNGIDGHFDMHFAGSTRHKDGKQDPQHQKMIKIAAGIK